RGVALASGVAALGLDDDPARGLVGLDDARRALVLGGDGPDLDLDDAPELVALDLLELRPGHARRDALDVAQHVPGLLEGDLHPDLFFDLHAWILKTSCRVAYPPVRTRPRPRGDLRAYRHLRDLRYPSSRPRSPGAVTSASGLRRRRSARAP